MTASSVNSRAFSLIELLVVIAIMGLMMTLAMPAITQTLRASKLTTAGQAVMDELNLARQTALSRNAVVEVRYYMLPDYNASSAATPTVYRSLQSFVVSDGGTNPVDRPKFLPSPVVFSPNATESALLSSTNHAEQASLAAAPIAGFGTNYRYRSIRFAPDGSVDLQSSENFFTLVLQNDKPLSAGANFFTVQLHPISGSVRSFRP